MPNDYVEYHIEISDEYGAIGNYAVGVYTSVQDNINDVVLKALLGAYASPCPRCGGYAFAESCEVKCSRCGFGLDYGDMTNKDGELDISKWNWFYPAE